MSKLYAYFGKLVKKDGEDILSLQTRVIKEVVHLNATTSGVIAYVLADDGKAVVPVTSIKDFVYMTTEPPGDGRL